MRLLAIVLTCLTQTPENVAEAYNVRLEFCDPYAYFPRFDGSWYAWCSSVDSSWVRFQATPFFPTLAPFSPLIAPDFGAIAPAFAKTTPVFPMTTPNVPTTTPEFLVTAPDFLVTTPSLLQSTPPNKAANPLGTFSNSLLSPSATIAKAPSTEFMEPKDLTLLEVVGNSSGRLERDRNCCKAIDPCHGLSPELFSNCVRCGPLTNTTCEIPNDHRIPDVVTPTYDDEPVKFASALVEKSSRVRCSASVISKRFLLSACLRCLQENGTVLPADSIQVVIADFPINFDDAMVPTLYDVTRILLHPGCLYQGKYNLKYDVGLVQTLEPIPPGPDVAFAVLPRVPNFWRNNTSDWIVSALKPNRARSTIRGQAIWYVKVQNLDHDVCESLMGQSFFNRTYSICTNYHHWNGKDFCEDDFGASLSYKNQLIGILAHKYGCGLPGSVASFVDVSRSQPWIKEMVSILTNGLEQVLED